MACSWAAATGMPRKDVLERFRLLLVDPVRARHLHRRLERLAGRGYQLQEPTLKGPPRGYRKDHPEFDLLRVTNLVVGARHRAGAWLSTPEALDRIREGWGVATAWNDWLKTDLLAMSP